MRLRILAVAVLALLSGSLPASRGETVRVWAHQGQETERVALTAIAEAFNATHRERGWKVQVTFFPDFQFTEKIAIAAAARDLPDATEIDGPLLSRYVAAGLLAPLSDFFSPEELDDFLPTVRAQGTIDGKVYALGAFDSAMVLYYDKELFARAGVANPTVERGWSWVEFVEACRKLKAAGIEPVSLHMNESADEWFTYAFSPLIWSGGGELISDDGGRVRGVLSSDANIRTLRAWQALFAEGLAQASPVDPDPFGKGRVAMDWSGHWNARPHVKAKGGTLGVIPLPQAGERKAAPCGSWCWAMSAKSVKSEATRAWLKWVTSAENGVIPMVRANGAVPGRRSAFAAFPEYEELPYRLFREQSETAGHPRPRTPFYASLTQHFAGALRDISHGADVGQRLRAAEDEIQKVIDRRLGNAAKKERP